MAENFTVVLQGLYLDPEVPLALYLADVTINAVSSVITIIGNALIMVALRKIPLTQVHAVFKVFLFNLALADLGVGVIVQPLYISAVLTALGGYQNASRILGASFYLSNFYFPNMSLLFLTGIAIDRFLALQLRLRYRNVVTFCRVVAILVFLWFSTFASTSIIVYDTALFNISANCGLAVCLSVTTICYLKIYLTLRRHDRTVREVFPLQTFPEKYQKKKVSIARRFNLLRYKRSVYNMLYVYVAFIICFLPFFCILMIVQVRGVDRATKLSRFLGATLIFINSSLNPVLYCWKIRELRRVVLRTIKHIFCN